MSFQKGNIPWNKGLTKETDERVASYGKKISKTQKEMKRIPWNKNLTKETDERIALCATKIGEWSRCFWEENREYMLERQRIGKEKSSNYPWSKGLTVEDDVRVRQRVEASSIFMREYLKNPENHWNYRGGISKGEYGEDWTEELKNLIRNRDDGCMLCGIERGVYISNFGVDLCVHHIDGDKMNNDEENLICLCRKCHPFVHNSLEELPELVGMWI